MLANKESDANLAIEARAWETLLQLSTQEVFEMMLGSRICPAHDSHAPRTTDFTAMVGLAGKLCGVLSVRCSQPAALLVTANMLATPVEEVTDGGWDALGELANMIAGNFKAKLSGAGNDCLLSVPTVVTGGDYETHSLTKGAVIGTVVEFENLPMWISLQLHQ